MPTISFEKYLKGIVPNDLLPGKDYDTLENEKARAETLALEKSSSLSQKLNDKDKSDVPIIANAPNLYNNQIGYAMSNFRFIKFIPSSDADYLQEKHPNAFLLLCLIAKRARRTNSGIDGLEIGMAIIGDYKRAGIETEKKYRTAKATLVRIGAIEIVETCRKKSSSRADTFIAKTQKCKNWATSRATSSTIVRLLKSDIWDVNFEEEGDLEGDPRATPGRPEGDKQERKERKEVKEVKETYSSSSSREESSLSNNDLKEEEKSQEGKNKKLIELWELSKELKLGIEFKEFEVWARKYTFERIESNFAMIMKELAGVKHPVRWMQRALMENYAGNGKIEENKNFAEEFAKKNKWNDIKILKKYCKIESCGWTYAYDQLDFKEVLQIKYEMKNRI